MAFRDIAAEGAHITSEEVKEFTGALHPLCTQTPTFEDWTQVS
jgi:hypothetical protein